MAKKLSGKAQGKAVGRKLRELNESRRAKGHKRDDEIEDAVVTAVKPAGARARDQAQQQADDDDGAAARAVKGWDQPLEVRNTSQGPTLAESRRQIEEEGLDDGQIVRVIAGPWAHQVGPVQHVKGRAVGVQVGGPRGQHVVFDIENVRLV